MRVNLERKSVSRDLTWIVVVLVLRTLAQFPSAFAATACGTAQSYFVGGLYNPPPADFHVRGVQGDLTVRQADICTGGDNSEVFGWVMLAGDGAHDGYSQIGYMQKNYGTYLRFFWEWREYSSTNFVRVLWGSPTYGVANHERVTRFQSDGHIHVFLDGNAPPCNGTDCSETPFDPLTAWTGIRAEMFGETHHAGDDVPGGPNSRADWNNLQYKNENDAWKTKTYGLEAYIQCYFHENTVNPDDHFEIWTSPQDHNC